MVLPEIFFHPTKIRRNETVRRAVSRYRGLAVVVARSYHVVLRPVCVRVWPRKSCVATGGGGVDSRSRFPNPRIMVCPPPHPAQGPPPPDDHQRPPPFVTHRSVFILIYICVVTAARERYGATKRSRVGVCARALECKRRAPKNRHRRCVICEWSSRSRCISEMHAARAADAGCSETLCSACARCPTVFHRRQTETLFSRCTFSLHAAAAALSCSCSCSCRPNNSPAANLLSPRYIIVSSRASPFAIQTVSLKFHKPTHTHTYTSNPVV